MKRVTYTIYIMMAVLLLASFSACRPNVSGTVYLDKNNNGEMDESDSALSGVEYKVTRDGKTVFKDVTWPDGSFLFKATKNGYYCIVVDSPSLSKLRSEDEAEKNETDDDADKTGDDSKSALAKKAKAAEATAGDSDGDGVPDSKDNCKTIANEDQEDEDDDDFGDPCDKCDSKPNKDSDNDGYTEACDWNESSGGSSDARASEFSAGKSCVDIQGSKASVDVYIPMDYSGSLDDYPDVGSIQIDAGDYASLTILRPTLCSKMKHFKLPSDLRVGTVWDDALASSSLAINPSEVLQSPSKVPDTSTDIAHDSLTAEHFPVVADPAAEEDAKHVLKFYSVCPDGTSPEYSVNVTIKAKKTETTPGTPVE